MIAEKQNRLLFAGSIVLLLIMALLMGGLLQGKPAQSRANQTTTGITETTGTPEQKTTMDKVSGELGMLKSKGWSNLASDLKRPRATTLLWYHLKKLTGFEPKVVFGNANKLETAIAIPLRMGGDSSFPVIRIKGVDYYVIDPVTPEIIGEFDYGYVYDDPGSVMPGFFNDFRLNTDDLTIVEQWMSDTGVSLSYTDLPGR